MSLGVVLKGPEGLVLVADSRVTLQARGSEPGSDVVVNYDNATKLLSFSKQPFVAAVTYGAAVIDKRTAHSLLPELELQLPEFQKKDSKGERLGVKAFAKRLSAFYLHHWNSVMSKDYSGPSMTFVVAGFDKDEPYGCVFIIEIPGAPDPLPRSQGSEFGITWGGQLAIASRIITGFDPGLFPGLAGRLNLSPEDAVKLAEDAAKVFQLKIPYDVLPLQDCIDLATAMVTSTRVFQDLSIGIRGVGGAIDIAVITRTEGVEFIQRKALRPGLRYSV